MSIMSQYKKTLELDKIVNNEFTQEMFRELELLDTIEDYLAMQKLEISHMSPQNLAEKEALIRLLKTTVDETFDDGQETLFRNIIRNIVSTLDNTISHV